MTPVFGAVLIVDLLERFPCLRIFHGAVPLTICCNIRTIDRMPMCSYS